LDVRQAPSPVVSFDQDELDGRKEACGQVMTYHRNRQERIPDDQPHDLLPDADLLDPRAVIDDGEENEPTRAHVRLDLPPVGFPALEFGADLIDQQRGLADVGQQGVQHLVEGAFTVEAEADTCERDLARIPCCHGRLPQLTDRRAISSGSEASRASAGTEPRCWGRSWTWATGVRSINRLSSSGRL